MTIAFVFPGQGSQSLGMMAELAISYQTVKSTFTEASDVLGYDLWQLVQQGPEAKLNQTIKTQPALLASSIATWRIWNELSQDKPVILAGHSLGEYSALVCSGVLNFTDAIKLVACRGAYMQDAVAEGTGSMAAILGLKNDQIEAICKQAAKGQIVSAANYNSSEQVVISGHKEAVQRAVCLAKTQGAKRSVILPVSVPSHCALMEKAANKFAKYMDTIDFKQPDIPVLHNVDAAERHDVREIKLILQDQLCKPVLWLETIQKMVTKNIKIIIECGPGKVLSGLIKRIDRNLDSFPIFDLASLEKTLMKLK